MSYVLLLLLCYTVMLCCLFSMRACELGIMICIQARACAHLNTYTNEFMVHAGLTSTPYGGLLIINYVTSLLTLPPARHNYKL